MARRTARGSARDATKPQWTVLVYMAGDNNLDLAGVSDLTEMKKVGSTANVNVLAQFDRAGGRGATKRYLLRKGTSLANDVVQSLGETNCGDPAVLKDFITWGVSRFPAEHYLLVLWNHGAGWDDANLYQGDVFGDAPPPVIRKGKAIANVRSRGGPIPLRQVRAALRRTDRALFRTTPIVAARTRGIAYDDDAQDFLDSAELKRVLAGAARTIGRKIDVLGMDACLMSMAEVAYQVRGATNVLVGSQESEPNDGWPYDRVLKALVAKPSMGPAELARTIVQQYLASYRSNEGVTQAAMDLAGMAALAKAVDALGKALTSALTSPGARGAILEARAGAQDYSAPYDDYCDLADVCTKVAQLVHDRAVIDACAGVEDALRGCVLASGAKGEAVAGSHGLSIYFPRRKVSKLYGKLDFVRATAWAGFLSGLLEAGPRRAIAA